MKTHLKIFIWALLMGMSFPLTAAFAEEAHSQEPELINKLQQMYRLYYLPFSIEFKEGQSPNDIFPFGLDNLGEYNRLLKPNELSELDSEFEKVRQGWKKKSLFLSTQVEVGSKVAVTQRLFSHKIPLKLGAYDGMTVQEQIEFQKVLEGKPVEVQRALIQYRYLRSFVQLGHEERFNFFIVGPHWCESSREYRSILETYAKFFPNPNLVLHSIVIEDPKEEIFDSKLLKELFPNPKKYSHDNVPRFLAIETVKGKPQVWEEGEALMELQERFFKENRGFLDNKSPLFKRQLASTPKANQKKPSVDPILSSATK